MLHYHGTPITPRTELLKLAGRNFCVSYADPRDVKVCHQIGQSVMLDNGAYTFWKQGGTPDWIGYITWAEEWLDHPTTWAVIPDVIDGDEEANDRLIWPVWRNGVLRGGAPVWHLHESLTRLQRLCNDWERVCFGSSAAYAEIGTDAWHRRVSAAFDTISSPAGRVPWVHMLRGMGLAGDIYPFASVDSTDVARNHNRPHNNVVKLADRWDGLQCPARWQSYPQASLELEEAM